MATKQMFGYMMVFGSCILLIMGSPSAGKQASTNNNTSNGDAKSIVTPGQVEKVTSARVEHPPTPSPSSVEYSPSFSTNGVVLESTGSPQHPPVVETAVPLSKSGEKVSKTLVAFTTIRTLSLVQHVSPEQETKTTASYTQTIPEQHKSDHHETDVAKAPGQHKPDHNETDVAITPRQYKPDIHETDMATTPGQQRSDHHETDVTTNLGQPKPYYHETDMTATPGQYMPDNHETPSTSSHRPRTTITSDTATKKTESVTPEMRSSGNNHAGIVLAVVFCILILLALMAFLYHRHRRHSGSTDFNAAGWAGQVALPDDSGLERDLEQEAAAVTEGEGGTRRNTLVTFFGKRQPRLPSVAMEDISGKGEGEERQQLLDEDTGVACTPEAVGEANGKIAESSVSSHEASTHATLEASPKK